MTRLRCLVHASFHDMVSKALQLKIEHLPRKAAYINTRGVGPAHRPPGVPYTPVDVGPLMWIEEQCLLGSFLWIVIFYELRRIYGDFDVPPVRGETVYISSLDTAETFWKKILCGDNNTQREQIATTLQWLDIKSGGRENISSLLSSNPLPLPNTYQHRYPKSTTLSDTEWETEEKWICNAFPTYGALCLWEARVSPISPLRCVDYAVFRPYGLIFWSVRRMDGLGFREAFDVKHRMWFALSFVLDQEDWDEVVKRQAERGFDPRAV
ncbi:hypothetical protein BDW74DRAFT_153905 [Aspergillus multicolor]|uniref:uncharacterized protein n=1 Tax=Aspergillus multicolor TaxID=41759 RepID=UPI003CCE1029